jgi:hypothetical protein
MSPYNTDTFWNPDLFRLPALPEQTRSGRRVSSAPGKFIMGPIDIAWVCQARQLVDRDARVRTTYGQACAPALLSEVF